MKSNTSFNTYALATILFPPRHDQNTQLPLLQTKNATTTKSSGARSLKTNSLKNSASMMRSLLSLSLSPSTQRAQATELRSTFNIQHAMRRRRTHLHLCQSPHPTRYINRTMYARTHNVSRTHGATRIRQGTRGTSSTYPPTPPDPIHPPQPGHHKQQACWEGRPNQTRELQGSKAKHIGHDTCLFSSTRHSQGVPPVLAYTKLIASVLSAQIREKPSSMLFFHPPHAGKTNRN